MTRGALAYVRDCKTSFPDLEPEEACSIEVSICLMRKIETNPKSNHQIQYNWIIQRGHFNSLIFEKKIILHAINTDDQRPSVRHSRPGCRRPRIVRKAQLSWLPTTKDRL